MIQVSQTRSQNGKDSKACLLIEGVKALICAN